MGPCITHHAIPAQETFLMKVEQMRLEETFRKTSTEGGFYSEADMRKPVSEGGLGLPASFD